eukprot:CAMPEP_0180749426 /NCGR_PEP_ID=MMETSP1038_2-20121128/30577_1 /TAXON_ID=632150 /ORGANISM="Azadinium spinosum, Strain 3D9" /LENGTH=34 /DNA_ID= /DNA_START= /DNA_END= /DNA_ORIENTATION=
MRAGAAGEGCSQRRPDDDALASCRSRQGVASVAE